MTPCLWEAELNNNITIANGYTKGNQMLFICSWIAALVPIVSFLCMVVIIHHHLSMNILFRDRFKKKFLVGFRAISYDK